MSWSVTVDGTQAEATRKLADKDNVPQSVKDALPQMLTEFAPEKKVSVSTYGHHDSAGGGNATITISTTT
jgi:hypothetical protein